MSDPFEDYDLDDDNDVDLNPSNKAPSNRIERFKGEAGRTYLASLMYFHPLEASIIKAAKKMAKKDGTELDKELVKSKIKEALAKRAEKLKTSVDELAPWQKLDTSKAQFKKVETQFCKQQGAAGLYVSRRGKDGAEGDKVWNMLEDPSIYYYTVILLYPTDRNGEVDVQAIMREGIVKPWRFAGGVFNRLIEINQNLSKVESSLSLANQDLKLKCKNSQFQNFDIDFSGKAIWLRNDKVRDKFLPQAFNLYEKMVDAREVSTADLKEKLGVGGGDSGEDVADEDMEDLLGNI